MIVVQLDEHISLLFENQNTVLFQIQELVNGEDLEDHKKLMNTLIFIRYASK